MAESIFRKKSLDRVASPEQLDDYVKVANPGVWMLMSGIIILLIGICVWGVFGRLESVIETGGICENGTLTCYIPEKELSKIKEGMPVKAGNSEFVIEHIGTSPISVSDLKDTYILYLGNMEEEKWLYEVSGASDLPDGTYKADIVIESIAPMKFIIN